MSKAVQESYNKEFIRTMQAKGLLPRTVTEASERRDKAYYETVHRIFPGPAGRDGMLERMLMDSTTRVTDNAHTGRVDIEAAAVAAAAIANGTAAGPPPSSASKRGEMQAQLGRMERQLQEERMARVRLEDEAEVLRDTLQAASRPSSSQQPARPGSRGFGATRGR